jgi:ABC-type branched-subunit amino acid transport system ATPase component
VHQLVEGNLPLHGTYAQKQKRANDLVVQFQDVDATLESGTGIPTLHGFTKNGNEILGSLVYCGWHVLNLCSLNFLGLANHPWLVLFDEPTGDLNSEKERDILALLKQFAKVRSHTIIVALQDNLITECVDRQI